MHNAVLNCMLLCVEPTLRGTVWHLDTSCNTKVISCGESDRVEREDGWRRRLIDQALTDLSVVQPVVDNTDCEMSRHEYRIRTLLARLWF